MFSRDEIRSQQKMATTIANSEKEAHEREAEGLKIFKVMTPPPQCYYMCNVCVCFVYVHVLCVSMCVFVCVCVCVCTCAGVYIHVH